MKFDLLRPAKTLIAAKNIGELVPIGDDEVNALEEAFHL
jgi:hypothetical protein